MDIRSDVAFGQWPFTIRADLLRQMIRPRNDYVSASCVIAILAISPPRSVAGENRADPGSNPRTGCSRIDRPQTLLYLDPYLNAAAYDPRASIVFWLDTAYAFNHGSV